MTNTRNYINIIVNRESDEGDISFEHELFHNPHQVPSPMILNWLNTWERKSDREFDHALNEMGRKVRSIEKAIAATIGDNPRNDLLLSLAGDAAEAMADSETKNRLTKLIASHEKWDTCYKLGLHIRHDPNADF